MRITLALLALLFMSSSVHAQVNLKAAYRLAFTDPTTFNSILQEHNSIVEEDDFMEYTTEFKDLKVMNGFELGLRYKFSAVAFEVGWMNKRRGLRAEGRRVSNGNSFRNSITTSINTLSAGLYSFFGPISIGGTIDYNYLKIKSDFEETPSDFTKSSFITTDKDEAWSSQFSISYDFSNGGLLGVTIRPYVDVYWSEFDLTGFNKTINNRDPKPFEPSLKETFATWGISFILYNGQQ